jgi:hypothetical protein
MRRSTVRKRNRRRRRQKRVTKRQRGGANIMTRIHEFIRKFKDDDTFAQHILDSITEMGRTYFGEGYRTPDSDIETARDNLRTYTKSEFAEAYEKMTGSEYDEEMNQTALSDAFRHAVVVDITDTANPVILPIKDSRFAGMTDDYVFIWSGVEKLAAKYPMMFVLHADTEDGIQIHIPVSS